jgi:hypothetical protein
VQGTLELTTVFNIFSGGYESTTEDLKKDFNKVIFITTLDPYPD